MRRQLTSFSSRITAYFGALLLAAMGLLFLLWYFGFSPLGLMGASQQRLVEAMRLLEVKADLQRSLIAAGLKARRGDILIVSENKVMARQLDRGEAAVQQDLERVFERLQRAYPDRYQFLVIADPRNQQIVASSVAGDAGRAFYDPALLLRAAQPGAVERIEQVTGPDGAPSVAIVRQIFAQELDGYPMHKLVGIVIGYVNLQQFLAEGLQEELPTTTASGVTQLFDARGQVLAHFPLGLAYSEGFTQSQQVVAGFEGTLLQRNVRDDELVVVYRHLQLSGSQGWTLVHFSSKAAALGGLKGSVNMLMVAGVLLTLLTLLLIRMVARRLTQPLHALTGAARQLGAGELSVRVPANLHESAEIVALTDAFNGMAQHTEEAQQTLESKVLVRTSELANERDRAQGYLDIVGVMLVALDATGRIAMINRKGGELLGLPEKELIGLNWFEHFLPVDERDAVRQAFVHLMSGDATPMEYFENHIVNAHGQRLMLAWNNTLLRDEAGAVVGTLSSAEDITARQQAREALRIAATAFESQEGIFVTDAARVILRVNKAFSGITGYTEAEAVGRNPRLLSSGRHDAAFYAGMWGEIARTGAWQGEIWNRRKCGEVFPEWLTITAVRDDAGLTTHYVASFSDITSRKTAEGEIQSLAFYDPLTGLPNRRLLMDRLAQAMAERDPAALKGALLFVDLDNFKTLNDTLGHANGDLLLQQVAQRLVTCTREGDTVARLGGDEFVVLLDGLSESTAEAATQAEVVAAKIIATLNQSYQLGSYVHRSTPSIGITLFGDGQESIDEPLKRADMAMYQAKAAGRNTSRFFDPLTQALVTARVALEADLHEALTKSEFLLYFQPQVTGDCQLTGVEALVRWLHPVRGLVSPAEFIPLAEESGLILPLGSWVLATACEQLACWASRPDTRHLTIAVNVSVRQFHQADFVDQVLAVLERTGANPQRLKLELTESLLVANVEDIICKMSLLKAKGVSFSLDDFGTGYSSLSYLKRLPLDQLKIDQGFVRDILLDVNDAAIARMVIVLAESLGLAVIAEGVETEAQRDFLAAQGCLAYQGYLFSRPLPLDQLELFMARR